MKFRKKNAKFRRVRQCRFSDVVNFFSDRTWGWEKLWWREMRLQGRVRARRLLLTLIGLLALTSAGTAIAQPAPAGYWKFNGNARDASGKGNHGEEAGGPRYAAGRLGSALQLDGADDYVKVPSTASLETWHSTKQLTIEAWIFPARTDRDMFVFGKQGGECLDEFSVSISAGGTVLAQIVDDCDSPARISSSAKLEPGKWYHVAYVWDGTSARLYINGELDGYVSNADAPISFKEELHIGHVRGDTGNESVFQGLIDEVRLWNVARTQAEIQANMDREIVP